MITAELVFKIFYGFLGFAGFLIVLVFVQKHHIRQYHAKVQKARQFIFDRYVDDLDVKVPVSRHILLAEFVNVSEQIIFSPIVKERLVNDLIWFGFIKKYRKELFSLSSYKRKRASFFFGYINTQDTQADLTRRLEVEKSESVKFYIVNALKKGLKEVNLITIIRSMVQSSERYMNRVTTLLTNHYFEVKKYLPNLIENTNYEMVRFVANCAAIEPNQVLKEYVIKYLKISDLKLQQNIEHHLVETFTVEQIIDIRYLSARALSKQFPEVLDDYYYLTHPDPKIKSYAIEAIGNTPTQESVRKLFNALDSTPFDQLRIEVISRMVMQNKELLLDIIGWFEQMDDAIKKDAAAKVLATRMEDMILRLKAKKYFHVRQILSRIIDLGYTAEIIDFVNQNKSLEMEDYLIRLMIPLIKEHASFEKECRIYMKKRILEKLKLTTLVPTPAPREKPKPEKKKIQWMVGILIFSIVFFPIIYLIRYWYDLSNIFTLTFLIRFVVEFNYYIVLYYVVVNIIYFILILLSFKGANNQIRLWRLKKNSMMFEVGLLPTISIIAPAYNEELSVIESVTSLLNLKYPKYEVVVVNDGSKDMTLQKLIDHFGLERKNPFFEEKIPTKSVRGIYATNKIPNLVVVDKENGGKADALNVGINVAKYTYVCGIDADSLLEGESLQKLIAVTLDYDVPYIALGGNIHPSNGCQIDRGKVEKKGLGKGSLIKFQSIEYLRAFTTGRIGWAQLRSLLIISGAFGLFDKRMLIQVGGYLTSSSILKKDTVGEDMELVVRMSRKALEAKKPFRVDYIYNASCYTQLPADMNTLLKQRNRWHRGLIDILSYHRKVLFHPNYKQLGLIAYPYFLIFEVVGPLFEIQGYFMLLLALIFGFLNPPVIGAIFIATIGLGIVISLASLLIAEKEEVHLSNWETAQLVFFSIIENIGYRQLISLYRARGFISALREKNQWGAQKRQGFQASTKK